MPSLFLPGRSVLVPIERIEADGHRVGHAEGSLRQAPPHLLEVAGALGGILLLALLLLPAVELLHHDALAGSRRVRLAGGRRWGSAARTVTDGPEAGALPPSGGTEVSAGCPLPGGLVASHPLAGMNPSPFLFTAQPMKGNIPLRHFWPRRTITAIGMSSLPCASVPRADLTCATASLTRSTRRPRPSLQLLDPLLLLLAQVDDDGRVSIHVGVGIVGHGSLRRSVDGRRRWRRERTPNC